MHRCRHSFDLLERGSFFEKDLGKNSSYLRPITNIDEPNVFHISYKLIRQRDDFFIYVEKERNSGFLNTRFVWSIDPTEKHTKFQTDPGLVLNSSWLHPGVETFWGFDRLYLKEKRILLYDVAIFSYHKDPYPIFLHLKKNVSKTGKIYIYITSQKFRFHE